MIFDLITLLADGELHSGVELGNELGMTRGGVWKLVSQLGQFGLATERVKGTGYRLREPLSLLSDSAISDHLDAHAKAKLEAIQLIPSLNSTNEFVKTRLPPQQDFTLCLAEHQTQGKGRRGKNWLSPYGKNLYLSLGLRFDGGFEALSGLSLVVGVAVADVLTTFTSGVAIKWPNDIWVDQKKIAGILVEIDGEQGGPLNVVIGVGVNVNMLSDEGSIDQPWTSLIIEQRELVDRSLLTAALVNRLLNLLENFKHAGFAETQALYAGFDGLAGKWVELHNHDAVQTGICRGIDERGFLLLESDGSKIVPFSAGELSLRVTS